MTMKRVMFSALLALVFSASFLLQAQQPPPAGGQGQAAGGRARDRLEVRSSRCRSS